VRAWAVNGIGTGPVSGTASIKTGADVPPGPGIGAISAIRPDSAAVAWSPPASNGSPITGYTVQCATDSGFTHIVSSHGGITGTSYTITGLSPLTTYYVRVSATNGVGTGPYSNVDQFQTLPSVLVPSADGTAWVNAAVYLASGGQWVPAAMKTPSTDGTAWV
jgi:hypothetical protein